MKSIARPMLGTVLFCWCTLAPLLTTANDNPSSKILAAKRSIQQAIDTANAGQLWRTRKVFEAMVQQNRQAWLAEYYLGYIDAKLHRLYTLQKKEEQAEQWLESSIGHLEKSIELKGDFAESYALLNVTLGAKIGTNPFRGMTLGPRAGRMIEKAMALAPNNPRVWLIQGQSTFYMPKMFGGGAEKALAHIEKSIRLFNTKENIAQEQTTVLPSWGRDDAYVYLTIILMDLEDYPGAKKAIDLALTVNPKNWQVKHELLPQWRKKTSASK